MNVTIESACLWLEHYIDIIQLKYVFGRATSRTPAATTPRGPLSCRAGLRLLWRAICLQQVPPPSLPTMYASRFLVFQEEGKIRHCSNQSCKVLIRILG